jgi:hypothetical protein
LVCGPWFLKAAVILGWQPEVSGATGEKECGSAEANNEKGQKARNESMWRLNAVDKEW